MKHSRKGEWEYHVVWTNWTFGLWWGTIGKYHRFGIDFGPIEILWKKRRIVE